MPNGTNQEQSESVTSRLIRWLRENLLQRLQPPEKSMPDPTKEIPISKYKEMLDAGTLELLTRDQSQEEFRKAKGLLEQARKNLGARPAEPK